MTEEKKFNYTEAMAELEVIAAKVEDPKTALEDIGTLVARSKQLLAACRDYLRSVRDTVEADGTYA